MRVQLQLARIAHDRRPDLSSLREKLERIKQDTRYSPVGRRQAIEEALAASRRELQTAHGTANGPIREARKALVDARAALRNAGDGTALLLHEQRLGRHLETLRRRFDAGGLTAEALQRQLQEAAGQKDTALLDAVRELLPEFVAAHGKGFGGPRTAFHTGETARLQKVAESVQQLREAWKSPEERGLDAAEAELSLFLHQVNQERVNDMALLAHLEGNTGYYAGETQRFYGEPLAIRIARTQGLSVTFLLAGEAQEAAVGDPLSWRDTHYPFVPGRTAEAAAAIAAQFARGDAWKLEIPGEGEAHGPAIRGEEESAGEGQATEPGRFTAPGWSDALRAAG